MHAIFCIQIMLILAKLFGLISWSWLLVIGPTIGLAALFIAFFVFLFICAWRGDLK